MAYTFEQLRGDYAQRWDDMSLLPSRVVEMDFAAKKIIAGKTVYQTVERHTGVPWAFVGVLHWREASCDFAGVLHNGEKILGTGHLTRLEPKGRGPFVTWVDSALDALAIKGYRVGTPDWTVERALFEGERFNGFGYRYRGLPSAYLWSGSDQYKGGKFVRDGQFDASVQDKQTGIAPLMARLLTLDKSISFGGRAEATADMSIAEVQRALNGILGINLKVDGKNGPLTARAIKTFQERVNLKVDGIPGPLTMTKIIEALRTPAAA